MNYFDWQILYSLLRITLFWMIFLIPISIIASMIVYFIKKINERTCHH